MLLACCGVRLCVVGVLDWGRRECGAAWRGVGLCAGGVLDRGRRDCGAAWNGV